MIGGEIGQVAVIDLKTKEASFIEEDFIPNEIESMHMTASKQIVVVNMD